MKLRLTGVASLIAASLLAGCGTVKMREDEAAAPAVPEKAIYTTQIALGRCILTPDTAEAAPIVGALLSGAISEGVNRIGAALTEAAARKEVTTTATRNVEVSNKSFGPCVQIFRGWFYVDPKLDPKNHDEVEKEPKFIATAARLRGTFISEAKYSELWRFNGMWLAALPEFAFEGRIVRSGGDAALTVVPQLVHFQEPLFTRTLRPSRNRHVAVFLAFHAPDESANAKDNPAATLVIGNMDPGETRKYPFDDRVLRQFHVQGQPLNRWPFESDWFTVALNDNAQPMTVTAAVTETQDASEFLGFIAAVFGASKEQITEAAQTRLIPEKRASARATQAANLSGLEEKIDAAQTALLACKDADPATASHATAARKALREINPAAITARQPTPVDEACVNTILQTGASDQIRNACQAALNKIASGRACKGAN